MNQMFTYNQEQAVAGSAGGGGEYLTESAVVKCRIDSAKWTTGSNGSQSGFLELDVTTESGQKANYLRICHAKRDGTPNEFGQGQIQSLMGVTGVKGLTSKQHGSDMACPELIGKPVSLALERENYIKGDGKPGFKFEIKAIMSSLSGKTVAEHVGNQQPETAGYWAERFKANPQGNAPKQTQQAAPAQAGYSQPPADFDDDIPF